MSSQVPAAVSGRIEEAADQSPPRCFVVDHEEEARKLSVPPPGPLTLKELTLKFYETVADLLGNPPRLLALIVEIKGKSGDDEE